MPAKKKTDPEVEEMLDEKVEEKNEKRADDVLRAEDILTVEARDVVETDGHIQQIRFSIFRLEHTVPCLRQLISRRKNWLYA